MSDQLLRPTIADSPDDDLLWGALAISQALNRDRRATYYMLESGKLPARKIGHRWVASRRALLAALRGDQS
jgi:hypothetical protein